jgi:hypothetical protein
LLALIVSQPVDLIMIDLELVSSGMYSIGYLKPAPYAISLPL